MKETYKERELYFTRKTHVFKKETSVFKTGTSVFKRETYTREICTLVLFT